jgi:hypothetical protein
MLHIAHSTLPRNANDAISTGFRYVSGRWAVERTGNGSTSRVSITYSEPDWQSEGIVREWDFEQGFGARECFLDVCRLLSRVGREASFSAIFTRLPALRESLVSPAL